MWLDLLLLFRSIEGHFATVCCVWSPPCTRTPSRLAPADHTGLKKKTEWWTWGKFVCQYWEYESNSDFGMPRLMPPWRTSETIGVQCSQWYQHRHHTSVPLSSPACWACRFDGLGNSFPGAPQSLRTPGCRQCYSPLEDHTDSAGPGPVIDTPNIIYDGNYLDEVPSRYCTSLGSFGKVPTTVMISLLFIRFHSEFTEMWRVMGRRVGYNARVQASNFKVTTKYFQNHSFD